MLGSELPDGSGWRYEINFIGQSLFYNSKASELYDTAAHASRRVLIYTALEDDVVPVGLFLPLAGRLVLPSPVGCDGELGDGRSAGDEFRFCIATECPDEDY
jgi:hypothetical protein